MATEYTDWSPGQMGTTSKPKYGSYCRYKAVDGELWELAADGVDDHLMLTGPAMGPVSLTLHVINGGEAVMVAEGVEFAFGGFARRQGSLLDRHTEVLRTLCLGPLRCQVDDATYPCHGSALRARVCDAKRRLAACAHWRRA